MHYQIIITLLAGVMAFANDSKRERKKIYNERLTTAQEFCRSKANVLGTQNGEFAFKCKSDKSTISAYVRKDVLYTIYTNRPTPSNIQKVEVIDPNDDRWILFGKYYDEAVTRRSLDHVQRSRPFP